MHRYIEVSNMNESTSIRNHIIHSTKSRKRIKRKDNNNNLHLRLLFLVILSFSLDISTTTTMMMTTKSQTKTLMMKSFFTHAAPQLKSNRRGVVNVNTQRSFLILSTITTSTIRIIIKFIIGTIHITSSSS